MAKIVSKDGKTIIKGIPDEVFDRPDFDTYANALLSNVERTSSPGEYNYTDVKDIAQAKARSIDERRPSSLAGAPEERAAEQQNREVTGYQRMMGIGEPMPSTGKGLTDAFMREAGGPLAATGAGALAGSVVPGLGTVAGAGLGLASYGVTELLSPAVKKIIERLGGSAMDVNELENAIADSLGMKNPEDYTPAEKLVQAGTQGAVEAGKFISGANLIGQAGQLIPGAQALQGINPAYLPFTNPANFAEALTRGAQTLTAMPGTQVASEAVSSMAAEGGRQFAESRDWGPILTAVTSLGAGVLGDLSTSAIMDLAGMTRDLMRAKNIDVPEAAQEIINQAKARGVDMLLSDFKPSSVSASDRRTMRELFSRGTRGMRYDVQQPQRERLVENLASEFGVDANDPDLYKHLEDVASSFYKKRDAEFSAANTVKEEIIDRLSETGQDVDVSDTIKYIDNEIARLANSGSRVFRPIRENVDRWAAAVANGDSAFLRDEAKDLLGKNNRIIDDVAKKLDNWANSIDEGRNLDFIRDEIDQIRTVGPNTYKPVINELLKRKAVLEGKDLRQLELERESLRGIFSSEALENIRSEGDTVMNNVYKSLRGDMDKYIGQYGDAGDLEKFEEAMGELKTLTDDFTAEGIQDLMANRKTPSKTIEKILINSNPDVIRELYRRLPPEGQSAARSAMIAKMLEDYTKVGREAKSPTALAANIKKYAGQHGVLFSQEDGVHLETIGKILDRTSRSEREFLVKDLYPGEGLPGVTRLVTGVVARNPITAIPALLATASGRGWVIRQMEKPELRDLMLKYDSLPGRRASSLEGDEILKRMSEILSGYAQAEERSQQGEQ